MIFGVSPTRDAVVIARTTQDAVVVNLDSL